MVHSAILNTRSQIFLIRWDNPEVYSPVSSKLVATEKMKNTMKQDINRDISTISTWKNNNNNNNKGHLKKIKEEH